MHSNNILVEFKKSIITFIDELIDTFPSETDFVLLRIYCKDRVTPDAIMNQFIRNVLPHKDVVANRDDSFFLEKNVILTNATYAGKVNHFKKLWKSTHLDDDDKNVIWQWFDTFIALAERYQQYMKQQGAQRA